MLRFEDLSVAPGTSYQYRLAVRGQQGMGQSFGTVSLSTPAAPRFALHAVSPNPFVGNSALQVHFSLPSPARASLDLIDLQGRVVWRDRLDGPTPGDHTVRIDSSRMPAGVYFLRLEQEGRRALQRLVVIR
jgi:hypothetical protein